MELKAGDELFVPHRVLLCSLSHSGLASCALEVNLKVLTTKTTRDHHVHKSAAGIDNIDVWMKRACFCRSHPHYIHGFLNCNALMPWRFMGLFHNRQLTNNNVKITL